jgi:hypothetical protein
MMITVFSGIFDLFAGDQQINLVFILLSSSVHHFRGMSFSARIAGASAFGHAFFATLFWITILVALIKMTWKVFVFFPWWIFIVTTIYFTLVALKNNWEGTFGAVAKVYAPFVILIYWAAIYPKHNPWHDPTDTYLVIMAHIIGPVIVMIETVRARNTHYSAFRQRNVDFPTMHSFSINTIVYIAYLIVYLSILPSFHDPIYSGVGFTIDEGRDALLAFAGWIIVMGVNALITMVTWYWREQERRIRSNMFETSSQQGFHLVSTYVMNIEERL